MRWKIYAVMVTHVRYGLHKGIVGDCVTFPSILDIVF